MRAYYNEIDPKAAAWLRELIKAGAIAPGDVDERDIRDVRPSELDGFTQCHFFAGIGVWSYALRLAGWSDSAPVWTGSCPCQPFSAPGQGGGFTDERHLWPSWFHLIEERRPPGIFGEQVANEDADLWIDLVQADLEGLDYTLGTIPFPAAGVGAPHVRDRLYFVADAAGERWREGGTDSRGITQRDRSEGIAAGPVSGRDANGFWGNPEWILCRDGKHRPVEPGTRPLAHEPAARMGRLRGYGNAIVAQQAAAFIEAYMHC